MTDRELLELAAKAAGYVLVWGDKYKLGDDEIDCTDISYIRSGQPDEGDIFWNPLTDDGDALRLAVKLAIDFKIRNEATWWDHQESEGVVYWSHEPHNGDPLAATRRAIVRAAAELGRSKE